MVDAELPVRQKRLQTTIEPLDDFTKEDTALGEWIQELGVRAFKKILRQQVQNAVCEFWRGKNFVVTQIGNAV